ncbi:hypothetical protein JW948_00630 [bacterium]|nr:hypothetical protein [bacterium]
MKNQRSLIVSAVCASVLFVFASSIFAGNKVNFSGTWLLDASRVEAGAEGPRMSLDKMVVIQKDDTLSTEKFMSSDMMGEMQIPETVTLDGKECVSETQWGGTRHATAAWSEDGKVLTIKSLMKMNWNGEDVEMHASEVWSLEKDSVLKMETMREGPMGVMENVMYFNKSQE